MFSQANLKQFNRKKLWYPLKCVTFVLFNYSSLLYIILALSSALTNLPNKTLILLFITFKDQKVNSMNFQALQMKFLNSITLQVFQDLYQPACRSRRTKTNKQNKEIQKIQLSRRVGIPQMVVLVRYLDQDP